MICLGTVQKSWFSGKAFHCLCALWQLSTFHLPKDEALPNRQTGLPKPLVLQEGAEVGGVDGLRAAGSRNGGQGMGWKKPILGLWLSSSHTWETMKRSF